MIAKLLENLIKTLEAFEENFPNQSFVSNFSNTVNHHVFQKEFETN